MNALPTVLRKLQELAAIRILLPRLGRWHVSGALPLLAALAVPAHAGNILNVPGQYATIADAVNAAGNGDIIQVADGTYAAQGILTTKSISIMSVNGADNTFIDCGANAFATLEGNNSAIEGFTIENCTNSSGAITLYGTSTVNQCVFKNNDSGFNFTSACININGGATALIANSTFDGNSGLGGGLNINGTATVSACTFTNNVGEFGSGAVYANTASGTFTNCTFTSNSSGSGDQGGAISWINGPLSVTNSTFANNHSATAGGAIEAAGQGLDTPLTITGCTFSGNSAPEGGAVSCSVASDHSSSITASNCLFLGNSASGDGAAIDSSSGSGIAVAINLFNCSFFGNAYTGGSGAGQGTIAGDATTTLNLTNTILYGDTTPEEISTAHLPPAITASHSDIHRSAFLGVSGNIDADPLYLSPITGDLRLSYNSPAINAGTFGVSVPIVDILNKTRDASPDMGAYEYGLQAATNGSITMTQYQMLSPGLASFADTSGSMAPPSAFSATISWGDGTPASAGTITQPGGAGARYMLSGTHTYTQSGSFGVNIQIADSNPTGPAVTVFSQLVANVTAVPAIHFSVAAPLSVTAGTPFSNTITALDPNGNTVTTFSATLHFTTSDRYGIVPPDTAITNGTASFTFTLGTAGTQEIGIIATDNSFSAYTGIQVVPGNAALFGFRVRSTTAVDGAPTVLNLYAYDHYGNQVTDYAGTVHFTSTDPSAVLPANTTLTNGQGSFSATLYALGSQSITATDTVTSSINATQPLTVIDRAAAHFRINAAPAAATAGAPVTVSITALDTSGNIARGYAGTIHFTAADPQAVLPANATLTNGQGTFSVTFKTAGRYTVTITDTANSSLTGTSGTVTVSPGIAAHLKATAQASAVKGVRFGIVVQALDAYGNIATGYTGTVHLTSTDPNAILPADGVLYSGQRTFLATLKTLGGQTVTATDTVNSGLTATTGTVTITAH